MKNIRFFAVSIAALLIGTFFTRCDDNLYTPEEPVAVKDIVLSAEYAGGLEAVVGSNILIAGQVTVNPVEATNKTENFSSSDPTVATVDESGNVIALGEGTTVLTITVEGHSVQFNLTVIDRIAYDVTDIEFVQNLFDLDVDETIDIFGKMRPTPIEAEYLDVIFSSSNTAVATVSEAGLVTCVGAGEAVITVTSKADAAVSAIVTIKGYGTQPGFTIVNGVVTAYNGPGGDIRIPGTATSVAASVFKQNSSVMSVHLNKVTEIGNESFKEMLNITSVIAPNLKIIRNSVFQDCKKLETIEMERVEVMQQFAFSGTAIKEVYMPALITINDRKRQFGECKSLVSVDMPTLTGIGAQEVFYNCSNLKTINMPKLNTFNGGTNTGTGVDTFNGCVALEEVRLPSITILKNNTFANCAALKKLDLSSATGLTSVAASAVSNQAGLTIYVATEDIKGYFTGSAYTVIVGSPTP